MTNLEELKMIAEEINAALQIDCYKITTKYFSNCNDDVHALLNIKDLSSCELISDYMLDKDLKSYLMAFVDGIMASKIQENEQLKSMINKEVA